MREVLATPCEKRRIKTLLERFKSRASNIVSNNYATTIKVGRKYK